MLADRARAVQATPRLWVDLPTSAVAEDTAAIT